MFRVNIVGAGLAGLSAAVTLAKQNIGSRLISVQISERAQSVLAEGGINAAMDVSGEGDSAKEHFEDTMRGGVFLADPEAVRGLTETAPEIVGELMKMGVPFNMEGEKLVQRRFGGQKKTRTAYARSSTGKALMTAMIDAVRRYENTDPDDPLIVRYPHHRFLGLCKRDGICTGVRVSDVYTDGILCLQGPVILAFGGPNGLFPGRTTGTTANDGSALASVFADGIELANLEFIQYHPTTVQIVGKRMLVSEAARGEGGRLYAERGGKRWYFMEEKYPELGNLMPRDVVSREMDAVLRDPACQSRVWLDLTELPQKTWVRRLPDLRREIRHYLSIDPAREPVPVSPGIHFFMGGILVDREHGTNIPGVYAAGECACQYHGANRLGGNSLLGALYGGRVAAQALARKYGSGGGTEEAGGKDGTGDGTEAEQEKDSGSYSAAAAEKLAQILSEGLGIVRTKNSIQQALDAVGDLKKAVAETGSRTDLDRIRLGEAMLLCALARKETRGAHVRSDYPDRDDAGYRKTTVALFQGEEIRISFRETGA